MILIRQVFLKHIICHCWYFLEKCFRFQSSVCNGCNTVLIMSFVLSVLLFWIVMTLIIVVLSFKLVKVKLYLLKNADLSEKRGSF